MSEQRCLSLVPFLIIGVICMLSILAAPPWLVQAAVPNPPTRPPTATPVYPVRPATLTPAYPVRPPTVTVTPTPRPSHRSTDGAAIELHVQFLSGSPSDVKGRQDLWTMVEWQDGSGDWHDVEEWSAPLDEIGGSEGKKVWYVSSDLFGKGPFRWLVCPNPASGPIAWSVPFHTSNNAGEIVQVNVSVGRLLTATPMPASSAKVLPVTGSERHLGLWAVLTVSLIVLLLASALSTRSNQQIE